MQFIDNTLILKCSLLMTLGCCIGFVRLFDHINKLPMLW